MQRVKREEAYLEPNHGEDLPEVPEPERKEPLEAPEGPDSPEAPEVTEDPAAPEVPAASEGPEASEEVDAPDDPEVPESDFQEEADGEEPGAADGLDEPEAPPSDSAGSAEESVSYGLPEEEGPEAVFGAGEEDETPELTEEESASLLKSIRGRRLRRILRRYRPDPIRLGIVLAVVLAVIGGFFATGIFEIREIEVSGNSYYTDEEIINIGHAETGGNLIYQAHTLRIRKYLKEDPYIKSVSVRRKLPGTLTIRVRERRQTAAIPYGEDYLVIDEEGLLLRRTETEPKVTIVKGIKVSRMEITKPLEAENDTTLENALGLLEVMRAGDLYFTRIEMEDRYVRAYIYDSLVCTGMPKNLSEVIENGRLQQVIEELFSRNIKRGTIVISTDGYASFVPEVA